MKTLALTGLFLLQVVLVTLAEGKRTNLKDLLARIAEKRKNKDKFIEECSQKPIELGLVVDSSVSIMEKDFKTGQKFLSDYLDSYDIGSGKNQVRVAAVTFGKGVYFKDGFNLTTYARKADVLDHVTRMKFRRGRRTDTGDAIAYMRDVQMKDTRPWAPKFVIVVTDGNSQKRRWTKLQAEQAIRDNITMFAVGVGDSVSQRELLNLVGGDPRRVIRARSYNQLDVDLKKKLARKNCVLKPRPTTTPPPTTTTTTTTTTTPQAIQPCRELYPSDINFVFSAAGLGTEVTSWVTQFISHTVSNQELDSGFQYGVISGDCPADEGFELDRYASAEAIRGHLAHYDTNNLPALVHAASVRGFSAANGGRADAGKLAVIFLGKDKVDPSRLDAAIRRLQETGVKVFVSRTGPEVPDTPLPQGVRLLGPGSSLSQSLELVSLVCHHDDLTPEGMKSTTPVVN